MNSVIAEKQKKHWSVAGRIAELTGKNVRECRIAATLSIRSGDSHLLDGRDARNVAVRLLDLTYSLDNAAAVTEDQATTNDSVYYDFDYSLVQSVADLSKQHGYENVIKALKLYHKLVKGL